MSSGDIERGIHEHPAHAPIFVDPARVAAEEARNRREGQAALVSAAAGTWRAWWPFGEAAQARRAARVFLRSRRVLKKSGLCDRLAELEAWPSRGEAFASNASHRRLLGHGFRGIETDWNRLRGAVTLVQDVVSWLGSARARTLLSRAIGIAETLGEAGDTTDQLEDCIHDFAELLGRGAAGKWEALLFVSRNSANEQLAEICGYSARSVAALEPVRPADDEMLDTIQHSVAGARQWVTPLCACVRRIGSPTRRHVE